MLLTSNYTPRDSQIVVGTASTIVSNETTKQRRTAFIITNISTAGQIITLSFGKEAVANTGIILSAGASWYEAIDAEFRPSNLMITAISSAAAGLLSIHERSEAI